MKIRTSNLIAAGLALSTLTLGAEAAPITGVTYSYAPGGTYGITGKDAPDGTPQALADGIGQSDTYTPAGFFWEPGNEGTIYGLNDGVGVALQPSLIFDLGSSINLASVNIHYGVRQGSGIDAPASVDVLVDGISAGIFTGFDNSANADNFGDIRSNLIDLTGQTGQIVTLEFLGSNTFTGLTEVEFSAVPEPGSLALLGLGGLAILRRRRA